MLREMFTAARAEGRAVFLPFMTAGLPTPAASPAMFQALAAGGADGFEVGIPYSDPLMDGPTIQRGSDVALAAGAGFDVSLGLLKTVVEQTGRPSLAMTYANPVFRRGPDWFCGALADAGAAGVIVPDMPVEESGSLRQAASRHGIGVVLFVAPTSDRSRIEAVAACEPAFIYAVAEMGVTGERTGSGANVGELAERIREATDAPVVFGVGISTPAQVRAAVSAGADGVIVGSAMVRRVLEAHDPAEAASALTSATAEIVAVLKR